LQLNVQAQQSMCEFMTAEKTEKESALAFRLDRIPEGLTVLAGADVSKKRDTKLSVRRSIPVEARLKNEERMRDETKTVLLYRRATQIEFFFAFSEEHSTHQGVVRCP